LMRAREVVAALSFLVAASCSDAAGPNISDVPGYSIASVRVVPSSATIFVPDTIRASDRFTFEAIAVGKNGAVLGSVSFVWSSSDPSIAVVDSAGTVTPIMPGTVEISASAHKIGKATLVILPATESVEVSPLVDSIFVDEPIVPSRDVQQLTATATDVFGDPLTGVAFAWQSAAPAVATVDASGLVHAIGLGTAAITVTANGRSAVASIRVVPVVASVNVTSPATQVLALDTVQLAAVALDYSNATMTRTFTWVSSNPSVATVSATGRVIFLSAGQATFTARTAFRTAAVTITALERRLMSVDAGGDFTCGFANLGRGYCWGLAVDGRTAAEPDSSCFPGAALPGERLPCILPPKRMNEPEISFTAISAGGNFGCGIATDRLLYCWGSDSAGQIGNGSKGAGTTPSLATVKSERFTTISAGAQHACALNLLGRAFCWGDDSRGQLGDNRAINSTTPIPVADSSLQFRAISAGGSHTCGVTTSGSAYCWGEGNRGQLGNGIADSSDVPVLVSGGLSFVAIGAGRSHTCAIDSTGNMYCWGDNSLGQLGTGALLGQQLVPTLVSGPGGFTSLSAGDDHTCGIAGGAVKCWGSSEFGQVGDGNVLPHNVAAPVVVSGLQATFITAGRAHSCAINTAGEALCWGSNRWGALGNEYQAAVRATPQLVARPR
jgi:alpha-tubulin suppressor-like RCC1 family protein